MVISGELAICDIGGEMILSQSTRSGDGTWIWKLTRTLRYVISQSQKLKREAGGYVSQKGKGPIEIMVCGSQHLKMVLE